MKEFSSDVFIRHIRKTMQLTSVNAEESVESKSSFCIVFTIQPEHIQGVTGGADQTSGECSLGHTIPI